jgi:4a-hydroxytetrahydrobiopterin dehydratase
VIGPWREIDGALQRDLRFRDFETAFSFVGDLAHAAVDYERRPDLAISEYNHVRVRIANPHHAGITAAEQRLAAKVDAFIEERGTPGHVSAA